MQCKELEAVLESEGLSPLPAEAREHLAGCVSCQDLLADLTSIVATAKRIPAEVTPPDRIWISLRAQLEAEGIIRDVAPAALPESAPWWSGISELFRPRALGAAAAGLFVIFGSIYLVEHRGSSKVAKQVAPTPVQATAPAASPAPTPLPAPSTQVVTVAGQQAAHRATTPPQPRISNHDLGPSPTQYLRDSAAVLNAAEGELPTRQLANNAAVDASFRQNLRTLNSFIAECEARLKQNPDDPLTREYLNMAYQQKADLLNAMLDDGRSEH